MTVISDPLSRPDSPDRELEWAADDFGHIVSSRPLVVLTARSTIQIRDVLAAAGPLRLPVSARGSGYALYGQGQVDGGCVLDMAALNEVRRVPGEPVLVAGAGALWSDVVRVALAEGLTPPVLPDHLGGSVGGVLTTGGFGGSSHQYGLVADQVRELDVVTGTGEAVTCSRDRNRDLFHAVLAGLGQCALIVRATLRLVPAPTLVRRYRLSYADPAAYVADQRALALDDRFSHVCGQARPAVGGGWEYVVEAVAPYPGDRGPDRRPLDDALLIGGLAHDRDTQEIEDLSYEEYLRRLDRDERILRVTGEWNRPHPWLTLLLPEEATASFVPAVLADAAQHGLRTSGVVQLRPLSNSALRAPLLRRPSGEALCLLSLMRTARPGDPDGVRRLVAANRAVYERARALGGVLHPSSAVPMSPEDWRAHFGHAYDGLARAKGQYDPRGILTRGYGLWR